MKIWLYRGPSTTAAYSDDLSFSLNRSRASETSAKVDSALQQGAVTQHAALSFIKILKCNVDSLLGKRVDHTAYPHRRAGVQPLLGLLCRHANGDADAEPQEWKLIVSRLHYCHSSTVTDKHSSGMQLQRRLIPEIQCPREAIPQSTVYPRSRDRTTGQSQVEDTE